MAKAPKGIKTKLASNAKETSLPLRNGARICPTVRLKPTASMLEITKTSVVIGTALLRSCIEFGRARDRLPRLLADCSA